MKRRDFLATTTAAVAVGLPSIGLGRAETTRLRAEAVVQQVLPDGDGATRMLGFNGKMPGPEIRVPRGKPTFIDVENGLDQGTAVHWHGIRLDNKMDGVPMLTQRLIEPGETHRYEFVPPDAGSYWYHSHHISHEQVARGMMGPLIIEEDMPPDVDHDITALISDWRMNEDGSLGEAYDDRHSVAHAGYLGNFARAFLSRSQVRKGDRVRFRLINAATNRIFPLTLGGAVSHLIALDGMPLATPREITEIVLAPAQRADVIMDVKAEVRLDMQTRQEAYTLGEVKVSGTNTKRRAASVTPLPPHALPQPGTPSQHLTLTMMGGAMGGRHGGDNIWSLNNASGLSEDPFGSFQRDETARITLVNDTSFPHGIHLHGHHFYEVGPDGALGDLRDTSLLAAGQSRDILCVFDNPGRWLLHCHMLSHAFGGMRTWINVA